MPGKTGRNLITGWLLAILVTLLTASAYPCTIAVVHGSVTVDGRPLLWKNRDVDTVNQAFRYYWPRMVPGGMTHGFIGNIYSHDTTRVFMGINDVGFAVVNSNTYNVTDVGLSAITDGALMKLALESCAKVDDFRRLLDSTNVAGRTRRYNFAVIDSTGAGAMFECSYRSYVTYETSADNPIIARANFSKSGDNRFHDDFRCHRAEALLNAKIRGDAIPRGSLDVAYILEFCMRDLANIYDDPYPLPYYGRQRSNQVGYIYVDSAITICNRRTTSGVVIRGILPDEDPRFGAMFGALGQPEQSIAFPMWVGAGAVSPFLSQDSVPPLLRIIKDRRRQLFSGSPNFMNSLYLFQSLHVGIYNYTLPLERWAVHMADSMQAVWQTCPPTDNDIQVFEWRLGRRLFYGLLNQTAQGIFKDR